MCHLSGGFKTGLEKKEKPVWRLKVDVVARLRSPLFLCALERRRRGKRRETRRGASGVKTILTKPKGQGQGNQYDIVRCTSLRSPHLIGNCCAKTDRLQFYIHKSIYCLDLRPAARYPTCCGRMFDSAAGCTIRMLQSAT